MVKCMFQISLVLSSYKAIAAEYFISKSCNTANQTGSSASPFCTIQQGVSIARAGDTVTVRGGTYSGNVTFRYSGERGKPITLRSAPGEKAIIDQGNDNVEAKRRVTLIALAGETLPIGWIVIEGLEIARGWDGVKMYNGHDVTIRNCNIHHSLSQGVLGNGLRLTIDNNIISNNGNARDRGLREDTNQLHGIYLAGTDIKITNNVIHSNLGFGIQVAGYSPTKPGYAGPEYGGASNWLVANNTFAYQINRGGMIVWQSQAKNNRIENNIFFENATSYGINGVDFYGAGPGNTLRNNLFYSSRNLAAVSVSPSSAPHTASGNLMQINPMLRGPASFDFHLLSGSPAINRGLNGSHIGAFEYEGGTKPASKPRTPVGLSLK